jgi:hypothetical protein
MKEKFYVTEVMDRDDVINCTDVTAADIAPRQRASVRGSI